MVPGECQPLHETTALQQADDGEDDGEEIDAKHHLHGRHVVFFVEFVLPIGGETVKNHITDQDGGPDHRGDTRGGVVATGVKEDGHSHGYRGRSDVLIDWVRFSTDYFPHEHH